VIDQSAPATVSATEPDWTREQPVARYDPSRRFLAALRDMQRTAGRRSIARKLIVLRYRFWSVVTQADIPPEATIAGGLIMPHPNGIVVFPGAVIGPNCLLMQQVTLGVDGRREGAPRLGGHVDVSAGAKIIGPVTIGDHALIGANAVVTKDVEPGAIMVGVPARCIGYRH
jgi:serine O-acetyltransferase